MTENRTPWTPEPWHLRPVQSDLFPEIVGADGHVVAGMRNNGYNYQRTNAQRIIACVNALAGIADPLVVQEMVELLRELAEPRRDKFSSLESRENWIRKQARALLARIKGKG